MPQIAQQEYILIPCLDDLTTMDPIPQELQNRLVELCRDGRIFDTILVEGADPEHIKPFQKCARPVTIAGEGAAYSIFYYSADERVYTVNVEYREI